MPSIFTVTLNPGLDRTLTVPALHENSVLRATNSRLDWGGKGFNVTRALQAIGVESIALGIVGGFTGQMLSAGLADLGIHTDFVQIVSETRTNTVIEEAHSGRYIKVNESGPNIEAATIETLRTRILTHLKAGDYWAMCGSLPPGAPPDLYANLITLIQSHGALACLDASGEALRQGLRAAPYLVKPNAEEAAEIAGFPITDLSSARQAATLFLEQGASVVALSLGADGLLLAQRDQRVHARPPQVAVRTLVGVGDALLAGLLYALHHQLPISDMARWSVATGTAAAMTPGVGVGTLVEVTELLGEVTLA